MNKRVKRGYLQISFAWMFAIIVGAFILFLAIYFATKLVNTEEKVLDLKTGKEIGILLNPIETSVESVKLTTLTFPKETRIYGGCDDNYGFFGKQLIQISQKGFNNQWTETEIDGSKTVSFQNKYIFTEDYTEGKKFYILSKPFNFPFKIADLIYITSSSDSYCFLEPPDDIKEQISDLKQPNLLLEGNCTGSKEEIRVCFDTGGDCDMAVYYDFDYVEKKGKRMVFKDDALMYAAIFSKPETYECQVKRLMQRTGQLASLYKDKALFVSQKGCDSNLDLLGLINMINENYENSNNLEIIKNKADKIEEDNDYSSCRLW